MSVNMLAWTVVGLIAGLLAQLAVPRNSNASASAPGLVLLSLGGAIAGGWVWNLLLNRAGPAGLDFSSVFVAFVGSCFVIGVYRVLDDRSART